MSNKINFYVIGGQYHRYNHGGTPTLLGAKRLAAKSDEHWDNWQGWHRPAIYRAEDCRLMNNFYGEQMLPAEGANPVAVYNMTAHRWEDFAE